MSQIKLVHSGGNGVIISAPSSNPAANRTLTLPGDADGEILTSNSSVGKILQVLETVKTDTASQTVNTNTDFNPSYLRQSITTTGSNKVLVEGFINISMTSPSNCIMIGLRRNNSDVGVGDSSGSKRRCTVASFNSHDYNMTAIPFSFLDSPGAGTHEYHLQISHMSGGNQTIYINRTNDDSDNVRYPRTMSLIRCSEVAA